MFRASTSGPYDESVAKCTDEHLTTEDWAGFMDLCDRVSADINGPKDVTQALARRIAHRNANVQLYTLELANALSQNCGKSMHRELASRLFTDSLVNLATGHSTHVQVKTRAVERARGWVDMFRGDSDLGLMQDALGRMQVANPDIQAPSAPQKDKLTATDLQKEEDELQLALKLSLQEDNRSKAAQKAKVPVPSSSNSTPAPAAPAPQGTTAATISRVRALYDFIPSEAGELEFRKGDIIAVVESVYKDWWRGSLRGVTGIFPLNYVEKLSDPTPEDLSREAAMEAEVFAEIRNVEKLLALLSSANQVDDDNEEIARLYHQTTVIRPKLIRLIEKYTQKKDDLHQLNEKFVKARRDYEGLLEVSMAGPNPGPPPPAPGQSPAQNFYRQPAQPYQVFRPDSAELGAGQRPVSPEGREPVREQYPSQSQSGYTDYYNNRPPDQWQPQGRQTGYPPPSHSYTPSPQPPQSSPSPVQDGRPQQFKPYVPPGSGGGGAPEDFYR